MAATKWQYNGRIPKMSDVLRGNCCETCSNIPQKQEEFLNKADVFSKHLQELLLNKKIFTYVAVGSRFVLFEVKILIISLGMVKNSSDCLWRSNLFFPYRENRSN